MDESSHSTSPAGGANEPEESTQHLALRAAAGDPEACKRLFGPYRARLAFAVSLRADPSGCRRKPEDLIDEAFCEARLRLTEYLQSRSLPFYAWLRSLVLSRVGNGAENGNGRSRVLLPREAPRRFPPVTPRTIHHLLSQLLLGSGGPEGLPFSEEAAGKAGQVFLRMNELDREILICRHLEQLSNRETAAVVGLTERQAKVRHLRALRKIGEALEQIFGGS